MKAHTTSLISSVLLIAMSSWGYLSSETPSITALIPLFFGVILIFCYPGIKNENKIIAHVAVLLTLIVLVALFMPLKGAFGRDDSMAIVRISVMLIGSAMSLTAFIKSFIAARKNKGE
jgi:peptidoglycan/LPS O-acetylase OafA/YrhL